MTTIELEVARKVLNANSIPYYEVWGTEDEQTFLVGNHSQRESLTAGQTFRFLVVGASVDDIRKMSQEHYGDN